MSKEKLSTFIVMLIASVVLHVVTGQVTISRDVSLPYSSKGGDSKKAHRVSLKKLVASPRKEPVNEVPLPPQPVEAEPEPLKTEAKESAPAENQSSSEKELISETGEADREFENIPEEASGEDPETLKNRYLEELVAEIERRKVFPPEAIEKMQNGDVVVKFVIEKYGRFKMIDFEKRSAYPVLDAAAIRLISKMKSFKPLPPGMGLDDLKVVLTIRYNLSF